MSSSLPSSSDTILDEIYKLESRLGRYHDHDLGINFAELDNPNFDINTFISHNFNLKKINTNITNANDSKNLESSNLDLVKIDKALGLFHDIQRKTCEEIVLSIDKNLEKYIEISSKFDQMKGRLTETQSTFTNYNDTVKEYNDNVNNTLKNINKVVDSYNSIVRMENIYLEIEKFLNIIQECNTQIHHVFQDNNPFMLEDVVRLSYLINNANQLYQETIQPYSFTREIDMKYKLSENLNRCKNMILKNLEQNFEKFFINHIQSYNQENRNENLLIIKQYLQSFSYLNAKHIVEQYIEIRLMSPLLQKLETKVKEEKSTSIVATKQEFLKKSGIQKSLPIKHLYDGIINALATGCLSDYIFITEHAAINESLMIRQLHVNGFNLIINCIWKAIEKVLTSQQYAFIYSVGISDIFSANYKAAIQFLNNLKNEIKTPENRIKFIEDPSIRKFIGKWSLTTYYSLRFTEIIKDLEKNLREEIWEELEKSSSGIDEELIKNIKILPLIERCFNSKIFIKNISTRFIKLCYQIIHRYCLHLDDAYNKRIKNKEIFVSNLNIILYSSLQLHHLQKYLQNQFPNVLEDVFKHDDMAMRLTDNNQDYKNYNMEFIKLLLTRINKSQSSYDISLADYIFTLVTPNMEAFNTIPSKYRMTNKDKPKDASNFILNILTPMTQFFQNKNIPIEIQIRIREKVINKIYDKFIIMAQNLIKNEEKTTEVLSKYKGQEKGTNVISDFDKIKYQFYLDNLELQNIANKTYQVQIENFNPKKFSGLND